MIRLTGLNKYFNRGKQNEIHVINDISVDLPDKGMVAIFGKSGCGKTTLLNIIGGLDDFASGSLTIEGNNIRENTDDIRNRYIGYVFQNYNLNKAESCFENVADALRLCGISDREQIERRTLAALRNVGMEKFSERTPDTLSGGQQQRIAIARAIVKNPPVILADEPTGNLDEANTVMIMDLLREISRDHLVLIVTHEAHLVDYYCDTVIELSDGSIVSKRDNDSASGYTARDKNSIYLGEYEKTTHFDANTEIEYYGEAPCDPVKIRIVNAGGKLYLKVDTPGIRVLDDSGEMTFKEGVYQQKNEKKTDSRIDMSDLPSIECGKCGRLFDFRSSVKSGYFANFSKKNRGKNALLACLILFSIAVVMMTAVFGTAIGTLADVRDSYNHNVFYVLTTTREISEDLNEAMKSGEAGIDFLRLTDNYYPYMGNSISFRPGSFETFRDYYYSEGLRADAIYLSTELVKNAELLAGSRDNLADNDVLISSFTADKLIESSSYEYISDYSDLIGLMSTYYALRSQSIRIAGVVDSDEPAIYLTPIASAKLTMSSRWELQVGLDSDYGFDVKEGEATLLIRNDLGTYEYPELGDSFKASGTELTLTESKIYISDYLSWLSAQGTDLVNGEKNYFRAIALETDPALADSDDALAAAIDALISERHFEYVETLYSRLGEYIAECYIFDSEYFELWLYVEKGIKDAGRSRYSVEYYKAAAYKDIYGRYPTLAELEAVYSELPDPVNFYEDYIMEYEKLYMDEYYNMYYDQGIDNYYIYLVDESDYIRIATEISESHPSVDGKTDPNALMSYYTVIHSYDPQKTNEYLTARYPDEMNEKLYLRTLITPDSMFDEQIKESRSSIIGSFIALIAVASVMSLCMYFIMRSSLMNRIKEVGIYRAIGVTKKNILFRFFIESAVISALTVFVGYVLTSLFIFACFRVSPMVSSLFFYPLWMALAVLVFLIALCLVCGILPILGLLRNTPSRILSKYDI